MSGSGLSFVDRALELARGVLGSTSPNPAVGCVIVKDGVVVGEGATHPPGGPHAEKAALTQAGPLAQGATMYVSLEPCRHFGRTPPCTTAIIKAGIESVHIATLDPNPVVRGLGRGDLEAGGLRTFLGEEQHQALELNEAFFKWVVHGTPFVYVKFAASLDGKIAAVSGDSRWISGEQARAQVHRLRSQVDAIMVGVNTVLADDPRLTARPDGGAEDRQPLRIVVDSKGRTPPSSQLLKEAGKTLIAVTEAAPSDGRQALTRAGAEVVCLPASTSRVDLGALMSLLGTRDITSVLVEGGGVLLGSMLAGGIVDKVMAFIAPVIIGGRAPTPVAGPGVVRMAEALRLRRVTTKRFGDDILISGYTGG